MSANVNVGGGPDPAETACSIELARANGVAVVNMSISIPTTTAVTDQINAGYNQNNMVFVAAAGNTNGGAVTYPANLPNVVAVTATDASNVAATFAARGPELDLAAPGVSVLSTAMSGGTVCPGSFTSTCNGTSFASPHVAGAAALLRARYPSWSNATIVNRLLATATDLGAAGFDNTYGRGLVNALAALQMSVAIQGPSFVYNSVPSTWTAAVGGGQSPFSYQWRVNTIPSGTGQSFTYHLAWTFS